MRHWLARGPLALLLLPVGALFALLVALRRAGYSCGLFATIRLPVPVVVVGNITVGGSGKTPLVIHLVEALRQRGLTPGVISRGYGRRGAAPCAVDGRSDVRECGDEPLLIARRTGAPVVVGRDRVAAAQRLLAAHPEVDVLLSDDGLQHYRLARDVEIALFDARGAMNGWPLPAGPLREPLRRLARVDAIVCHGVPDPATGAVPPKVSLGVPVFRMQLDGARFHRLGLPAQQTDAAHLAGRRALALAGIGDPRRFLAHLRALGVDATLCAFADHHDYVPADIPAGRLILTTEKDAVKLARLFPDPATAPEIWVLPVSSRITPDLAAHILEKINGPTPA